MAFACISALPCDVSGSCGTLVTVCCWFMGQTIVKLSLPYHSCVQLRNNSQVITDFWRIYSFWKFCLVEVEMLGWVLNWLCLCFIKRASMFCVNELEYLSSKLSVLCPSFHVLKDSYKWVHILLWFVKWMKNLKVVCFCVSHIMHQDSRSTAVVIWGWTRVTQCHYSHLSEIGIF